MLQAVNLSVMRRNLVSPLTFLKTGRPALHLPSSNLFFEGPDFVRHRVEGEEEGGRGGEQDFCSEQTAFPSELQVQLVQVLEDHLLPGVQVEGQVRGQ